MKKLILIFSFFAFANPTFCQINLVPNPSFEDTVYCPFGTNQLDACANWLNFGNSPDYFNICTGFGGPPINYNFGYQNTHSGVGMAGVALYRRPNAPSGPNYREFIGVELSQPLIIGAKYYFSCFTNLSGQLPVTIACNKFGVNFYTSVYDSCCTPPINNFAMFYTDSILSDTINWFRLSGSFVADSAYKYLSIGNFFDDNNTDTMRIGAFPDYSYYYVDDVCVTTDSIYNQIWTGFLNTNRETVVKIWPNPCKNSVYINQCFKKKDIVITDIFGRNKNFNIECLENGDSILRFDNLNESITLIIRFVTSKNINNSQILIVQP